MRCRIRRRLGPALPSVAVAALLACSRAPAPTPPGPSPSGSTPPVAASAAPAPQPFNCFAWVHGAEFSTDCYRSAETCEAERDRMHGVLTRACEPSAHASCAVVAPGERDLERCFEDERACSRYRAMLTSRGIASGPCEGR